MNTRVFIITVVILITAAAATFWLYRPEVLQQAGQVKMADFPMKIGIWQGEDIPLSEKDYAILETRNLIMREYKTASGEKMYLYIIYSEDNRRVVHPPEICYTGGGGTIVEKSVVPLAGEVKANKFVIEDKSGRQMVFYWFKSNKLNTYSYLKQQLAVSFNRMLGKKISCAMIRISTDAGTDAAAALERVRSFTILLLPLLNQYLP